MLKIDFEKGTLSEENATAVLVDLKNVFGWSCLFGGPPNADQFRVSVEGAYHKAVGIPVNQTCPEINAVWSDLGRLPIIEWYQQWLESPWPLTSSSGRRYIYSEREGLRSA